ncbi:MAG: beta-propeller fold lactonase family protein [Candidatus Melainabacteria bacterium]|nr:beta-propeller fold lactonase family protein [Candidatus Melainabacteria bacterium]
MKRTSLFLLTVFFLSVPAFCIELPDDLKDCIKKKFPTANFKIDNSFVVNNETFLPLLPPPEEDLKPIAKKRFAKKKIELVYSILSEDKKSLPRLLWFSNGWIYVKVLKHSNETQTILTLSEISDKYREKFLKTKFPSDLIVPKNFIVKQDESSIIGDLSIKKECPPNQDCNAKLLSTNPAPSGLKGILYLTSPDTGKIIYLNLSDFSMINNIQTMGTPWEIAFDKTNKLLFVTDLAKDQIYELKLMENSILKSFSLPSMSNPRDIEISSDGTLAYILESVANDFAVYQTKEEKYFIKTKLPPNPTGFSLLKELNLIAITCPNANDLIFLNANDFSIVNHIMIDGGPERIITDLSRGLIYTANRVGNTVTEYDIEAKKIKNTFHVGETPVSLAIHPGGKWLYVGNGKSNSISIVDLESGQLTDTINLPIETQFPSDIKLTADSKWLVVTSETTNTISIIDLDLKKVAVKLDVGATTHAAYLVDKESEK